MGMSPSDAQKQIKHMIAFIEQESNEKVEEIDAKAEEEFSLEKGRLIQVQLGKINEQYHKKEKQVEVNRKIQLANIQNQARLTVLKKREDYIKEILEECRNRLGNVTKNKTEYRNILEKLITQGMFKLMEPEMTIRCRQADVDIVRSVLRTCKDEAMNKLEMNIKATIGAEFLPPETKGGIVLFACNGHIKVPNTLESRLDLIAKKLMPEIRAALFGDNTSRKFKD